MIIKATFSRILPTTFARAVAVLAGGTAASQAILVLGSPILTRLYDPAAFGMFAAFAAMTSIIGVVSNLRYELAIPIPKDERTASSLLAASLLACFTLSILTFLVVLGAGAEIAALVGFPGLALWLWLLPVALFGFGAYRALYYAAVRGGGFPAIAQTRVVRSSFLFAFQVGLYWVGAPGMVLGYTISQFAGAVSLARAASRDGKITFRGLNFHDIVSAGSTFRNFPIWSTWGALLNTAGSHLPVLVFSSLFSVSQAGLFALCHRVLTMPISLIGSAVADVLTNRAATALHDEKLAELPQAIVPKLLLISLAPSFVVALAAPEAFSIAFGAEWRDAGVVAQFLAPWLVLTFVTSPLTRLYAVTETNHRYLAVEAISFAGKVGTIAGVYIVGGGFLKAAAFFSAAAALGTALHFHQSLAVAGTPLPKVLRHSRSIFLTSLITASPLFACALIDRYVIVAAVGSLILHTGVILHTFARR